MLKPRLLVMVLTAAACASPEREVERYVAARAVYQKTFDSLWGNRSTDEALKVDSAWVADYGPRLRRIVPALEMPDLSDSVRMNIGSMAAVYEDIALADGFVYGTADSVDVFVSDSAILIGWSRQTGLADSVTGIAAWLKRNTNYADIFDAGAAVEWYADLPVDRGTRDFANAKLFNYAQDECYNCVPATIAVSAVDGRRVIIAQQSVPVPIPVPDACKLERAGYAGYLRCYRAALKADPRLATVTARAQALLDRLPSR